MPRQCLTRLFLPREDMVLTADPSAENLAWLKACFGARPVHMAPKDEVLAQIKARHSATLLDMAVFGLARRFPALSAQKVVTRPQAAVLSAILVGSVASLLLAPSVTFRVIAALLSLAFAAASVFRASLALLATFRRAAPPVPSGGMASLPTYTVLVPLYREAAILPHLVDGLAALDYPHALLDIKLVVEEDDAETIAAAHAARAGASVPFEIIAVPPGGPRTKPKAANYALAFARGEYLVVYDAEDRPEPDQLKKAVAMFRASPRRTACLQARLNFYNADQNWLTSGIMAQTPQAI